MANPVDANQPSLPLFPSKSITADDLERFSNSLIEAYWNLRITNPYPRTLGIKHIRIQLPPLENESAVQAAPKASNTRIEHPNEPERILLDEIPAASASESPANCFLHQKPKPTCPRCQKYLDWKQSSTDPQQFKRPRPS